MIYPCDKPCGNKTASGYCATTACINPKYSNIGTVQYGQGVQKCIVTKADRIRDMTDEELAEWLSHAWHKSWYTLQEWRDWLKSPVEVDNGT